MKKLLYFLCMAFVSICFTSCFSLLKADRLVYTGSIAKKVDAAIIDSVSKVQTLSDK